MSNPKDTREFKIETVDEAVAKGIREAAPFYEAWPVLREWLIKNGIALGNAGRLGWRALDYRPGHEGQRIPNEFKNLSEALAFALEHVKKHLQETEAAHE